MFQKCLTFNYHYLPQYVERMLDAELEARLMGRGVVGDMDVWELVPHLLPCLRRQPYHEVWRDSWLGVNGGVSHV